MKILNKKRLFFAVVVSAFLVTSLLLTGCTDKKEEAKTKAENTAKPVISSSTDSHQGAIHITKADFLKKVMNYEENTQVWNYLGDKPCIIDFYANWCGPCKIAGPILDELAIEYKDDIYVYKVNTEQERELAAVFGVQSIPTFLFCPQDGNPQMSKGIAKTAEDTKAMFKQIIEEFLLKNKAKKM